MGRSGNSWAKIGFFYLIFYGFLAGFFSAMLAIFLTTVQEPGKGGPKLTQFIENKPGLTRLDQTFKLREYEVQDNSLISDYVKRINKFLDGYNTSDHSGILCGKPNAEKNGKPCVFDVSLLGDCRPMSNTTFGLKDRMPCIFIRINKVFGWIPADDGTGFLELSCSGPSTVIPRGFHIPAFPFKGQKAYQSPVVAVKIDTTGEAQEVDCTLKGKHIKVSDSFNPSRAFGKIRIAGITSK